MRIFDKHYIACQMLQRLFGFDPVRHKVRTEIYAGITTFLTMAYILAVNPGIFSALEPLGMPTGAVFTATVLASVIGTLAMALYAKKPFALAPGMGINAFFVFTVCLGMGHTWQFALTAVFIEGILFIILSLFKVRELIANAIPAGLKAAIGGGIGLFIAFIGLQNCGIIVSNESTQVALATFNKPSILLALIGLVICGLLVVRNVMGGLLWGILLTALIGIPMGVTHLDKIVSTPPSIAPIFLQFEWSQILSWDMLIVVFTFLFVDMFDTIGTVIAVSLKADMVDREGKVEGVGRMLMADVRVGPVPGSALPRHPRRRYRSCAGHCGCYDADQHHRRGLGRLYRGDSRLHHHAADAAELQHQRRYHAGPDHVCADEGRPGHERHPPDQPHRVDPFRGFRTSIYPKQSIN